MSLDEVAGALVSAIRENLRNPEGGGSTTPQAPQQSQQTNVRIDGVARSTSEVEPSTSREPRTGAESSKKKTRFAPPTLFESL